VWQAVDYWAGGPIFNLFGYRLSIEPTGLGTSNVVDKPQMDVLGHYLTPVNLTLLNNQTHPADVMPVA
jgi:hypothetical protein